MTWLGLADGVSAGSNGVVFEVRVDGELVESRVVTPETPLRVLQVDLRPFAGRSVTLELAAEPRGDVTGDALVCGRPLLVRGYERAPVQVWMEER